MMKDFMRLFSMLGLMASSCMAQPTNLEEARALWLDQTKGLPTNYTFQFVDSRSTKDPVVVNVRDDAVTSVSPKYYFFGGPPLVADDYPTIPELFDIIDDAENTAISSSVNYNSKYGYPTAISVVYNASNTLEIEIRTLTAYSLLEEELKMMEDLWEASVGQDEESYSFTLRVMCFCTQDYVSPKRIAVDNSIVVSVTETETGLVSTYSYPTVAEIFGEIQQSLDNFNMEIYISFDPQLGYPLSFSTNPDFALADAGIFYELSDVVIGNDFGEVTVIDEDIGDATVVAEKPNLGATDDSEVTDDRDKINTAESGETDSSADGAFDRFYLLMGLFSFFALAAL